MNLAITAIYLLSFLSALLTGNTAAAGTAVLEGVQEALRFIPSLCAVLCLWSMVTELLESCGAVGILSRLLLHPLRILFPRGSRDMDTLSALAENAGANLLGLGNAATPAGIRAARGLMRLHAQAELNTLVVLNTASIQLIPAAAATLRASLGSAAPFDIMPAVWVTSIFSLSVGLAVNRLLNGEAA